MELVKKVRSHKVLKFPVEKTGIKGNGFLNFYLPLGTNLSSLFQKTVKKSFFRPLVLLLLTLIMIVLGNITTVQTNVGYGLVLIGLISVGIPHGAVDHLLKIGAWNLKKVSVFIFKYLFLTALVGAIWYFLPPFALAIFLAYSSWHWGQADGKEWNLTPLLSTIWGGSVLFYILGTHIHETNSILASMGNLSLSLPSPVLAMLPWFLLAFYRKQVSFIITIVWLLLSSNVPLLFAFGLYFIGQHSIISWQHLQSHLKMDFKSIWLHSLPFHAGAWILWAFFYFLWPAQQADYGMNHWGIFFIFLACISLPHVISMNVVYGQTAKKS